MFQVEQLHLEKSVDAALCLFALAKLPKGQRGLDLAIQAEQDRLKAKRQQRVAGVKLPGEAPGSFLSRVCLPISFATRTLNGQKWSWPYP